MKQEQLLEAIGGVEEGMLMETEQTTHRAHMGVGRVLLIAAMILKDSVTSIRRDLLLVLEETKVRKSDWENDPLCGMTQEEYDEMYERIRAELMEELKYFVEAQKKQESGSEISETE